MIRSQNNFSRRSLRRVMACAIMGTALVPVSALQAQDSISRPVIQALPNEATRQLGDALRALAQDPQSSEALIDAGLASLALDDIDAAMGFLSRAEAIAPRDPRIKAGMGVAQARQGQGASALRLFAEAEQAGGAMAPFASDRGLAYDLVGDNANAQAQYRIALSQAEDPVVLRRLAISQAISGDQAASEATLLPMLQRQDLSAYRARAFALAILGKADEAVSIAETLLPETLSGRLGPYLRFMPRLTPAQQAAAANLGRFPRAADIGKDAPEVLAAAGAAPPPPAMAQPARQDRLTPSGAPLGPRERTSELPPIAAQQPAAPAPQPAPPQENARPSFAIVDSAAELPASQPAPRPAPVQPAPQPPVQEISLAEAFADFSTPASGPEPAAGAVDITTFEPVREKPKPPPPPPPPPEPSRHWVQVGTGRNVSAFAFDWRRLKREAGGLLDDAKPFVAAWGRTNRLVTGPYPSSKDADEIVRELKGKGLDSFRFTSAEGEKVSPLD
ncbi:Flp pilus assembly protein TadD [Altererythrobacter atlanticus]|uniref:Uncharacterized protein n=1 Tax=Croceibacterium atlanticum TaxID=1267766 RepID=A0A0F7KPG3_9SPHN|nr:tetratricopeptide repeat protein [Croceibacterium atlanticum]AKH42378.1 hypothetical protein WYH_01337 [Croceibacterium atlanticum]MBB5731155.1 Flp pilus assembly protein TadD [Croceibacterium atlanticum]